MTNFEKIKQMSVEDMGKFIRITKWFPGCPYCIYFLKPDCYENHKHCKDGIKKWLESEVSE